MERIPETSTAMAGSDDTKEYGRQILARLFRQGNCRSPDNMEEDSEYSDDLSECKEPIGRDDVRSQTCKSNISFSTSSFPSRFPQNFEDRVEQLKSMYHVTSWRKKQNPNECSHGDNDRLESSGVPFVERRVAGNVPNSLAANSVKDKIVLQDDNVHCRDSLSEDASGKWEEVKVYYPSRNDPECIELSYSDIKYLNPERFISSTIINFYSQYLQRSFASLGKPRSDFYIFDTYFFEKLKDVFSEGANFMRLRRLLKGMSIFQKSYVLLPIHGSNHWSLVIICNPAKGDESGPILLHLDSLDIHPSHQIFQILISYLTNEWNYINETGPLPNLPFGERAWKHLPSSIEEKKVKVPQQENQYDCGIFVLYYMENFLKQAPERLGKEELCMFGRNWFKPEETSSLRRRIRDLLMEEFQNSRMVENGEGSSSSSRGLPETPDAENLICR